MVNQSISRENLILIDWVTFTTKIWSLADIRTFLGLDGQTWDLLDHGFHGYKRAEVFNGITIMYEGRPNEDGSDDMGICVEISGQGCRAMESFARVDWFVFFSFLMDLQNEFHVTRLDLAYDDHIGVLDKLRLKLDTDMHFYRSKTRTWEIRYGSNGFSIYHGSKKSLVMIRIYDKAAERGILDGTHWIRVEIQLRDSNASGAIQAYLAQRSIGGVYGGLLATYLVYCEECDDTNVSRWPVAEYWAQLLQGAQRIHIAAAPGMEYNVFRLERFLRDTAGGGLYTWIKIFGLESLPELLKTRKGKLNPKHKMLLAQYVKMKDGVPDV